MHDLLSLPVELISSIMGSLNVKDLINCALVGKQLRKIIIHSSKLQFTIELAKRRMTCAISPSSATSYVSRLQTLRDIEHAWKTFTWKAKHNLTLPPSGSIYEFIGGLYATGKENGRRLTGSISFFELPTSGHNMELRSWTHFMLDVTIVDFTMDPSQDLLVLIVLANPHSKYYYEVHLRSISTNEPHPKASVPKLPCLLRPASASIEHIGPVRVQISGDLIALLVKEGNDGISAHLEIWDWINSPQFSCKMDRGSGIDDFTFLSENAFLLVRPAGSLEVCTFPNPMKSNAVPISLYIYIFPQLSNGYMYWYITISSDPAPGFVPKPGREKQLYLPKPNDRIHVCSLYIFDPAANDNERRVHSFVFFVNLQSLLHPPVQWTDTLRQIVKARRHSSCNGASSPHASSLLHSHPAFTFSTSTFNDLNAATSSSSSSTGHTSFASTTQPPLPFSTHSSPALPRLKPRKILHSVQQPVNIPWSVWGPQSTRWFESCLFTDWHHSIYGLRTVDSVRSEGLSTGSELDARSSSRASTPTPLPTPQVAIHKEDGITAGQPSSSSSEPSLDSIHDDPPIAPRYLRLRDYNPYSVRECLQEETERCGLASEGNGKLKARKGWRVPRVVTSSTTTDVRGVFKHDVESRLPYVEVLSKEMFQVTDVKMDDCRLLLLQRGENGMLKRVDILTM